MSVDWPSYDPLAESYASVAERAYFAAPARDLVSLLDLSGCVRMLDAGAGTGAVASAASQVIADGGVIVALDPAVAMLRMAIRKTPRIRVVSGVLPCIPCRAGTFDVATAAFVLSHVADPEAALREIARVLTPQGRVGVSSWAVSPATGSPAQLWQSVVEAFIDANRLEQALAQALPSEARLAAPDAIVGTLTNAGFRGPLVEQRTYDVQLSTEAFIRVRLMALPSRFMQSALPAQTWEQFVATASRRIVDTFGPEITLTLTVNVAVAIRAA